MKRSRLHCRLLWLAAFASLMLAATASRGDIVTYNDGKVLKGIVEEIPGNPDVIAFQNDTGKLRVPKTRIREIQRESKAQGYIHIGNQHLARQRIPDAIQAYQQALDLEPANAEALKAMNEAQAKAGEQQRLSRSAALDQINKISEEARELIRKGEFKEAEAKLKEADKLVPSTEQRERMAALISDLYLAWAEERQDKLDQPGAEDKLNLALAANPNNDRVIDMMLKLWEKNPQKRGQTANIYESIIERHPDDKNLRQKLADLYYDMNKPEDAVHHYLELYRSSDEYKGSQVEERLVDMLGKLHMQYARLRQWDKAIHYFEILAAIDKKVDPTEVVYYQYSKKLETTPQNDVKARLGLAAFAEQNGLDQQALELYRDLLKTQDAELKKQAQAGVDRYAVKALAAVQDQFKIGNFTVAAALGEQVRTEYPTSTQVVEKVSELIEKANVEAARDRRAKRELAREVLQRGDEFYQTAWFHFNNIFSTERRNMPVLVSSRDMAKRYFTLAIQAYQEVLRIDPSYGTDAQSLVNVRLNEARALLNRLNTPPPSMPRNFGAPIIERSVN